MRRVLPILLVIVVAACSSGDENAGESSSGDTLAADSSPTDPLMLPLRDGPRRETSGSVPHVQLDAEPVPAVDAELRRRSFQLPGVEDRPSDRSLPGARGLALADGLDLARPEVIAGSSEFAHIHPDGSLHVWLPVDSAIEVERQKWGELHPWVDREDFWDGVVMVFTPETLDEVDVTIQILVDAYNFVTGASIDPTDIS